MAAARARHLDDAIVRVALDCAGGEDALRDLAAVIVREAAESWAELEQCATADPELAAYIEARADDRVIRPGV